MVCTYSHLLYLSITRNLHIPRLMRLKEKVLKGKNTWFHFYRIFEKWILKMYGLISHFLFGICKLLRCPKSKGINENPKSFSWDFHRRQNSLLATKWFFFHCGLSRHRLKCITIYFLVVAKNRLLLQKLHLSKAKICILKKKKGARIFGNIKVCMHFNTLHLSKIRNLHISRLVK